MQLTFYFFDMAKVWSAQTVEDSVDDSQAFAAASFISGDQRLYGGQFEVPTSEHMSARVSDTNIMKTDRDYYAYFMEAKVSYLRLAEKVDVAKRLMEKAYNQSRSMEALMKHSIYLYE